MTLKRVYRQLKILLIVMYKDQLKADFFSSTCCNQELVTFTIELKLVAVISWVHFVWAVTGPSGLKELKHSPLAYV